MEWTDFIRAAFGLIAVLGLIGVGAIIARKAGLVTMAGGLARTRRLAIVETLPLDARRRVVIVKCDDAEHLIILGPQGETVINADLPASPAAAENNGTARLKPLLGLRAA